jgi:DNA-binding LytR/AlgR family response regulator
MKKKAHILVVEDKSLIYKRIKMILKAHHYDVDIYTPSVEKAIGCINKKRPDLVLLDIDLQGEHDGRYLGKLLHSTYHIPFIYVTDYDDTQTFYESLDTAPNDFISKEKIQLHEEATVLHTKPHLDEDRLIRAIQLALKKIKTAPQPIIKDAIIANTDYIDETKHKGNTEITQVIVPYKDVAYFTTNSAEVDEEKTKFSNKIEYVKMRINNTRLQTWDGNSYIIPDNLSPILRKLPNYFVRISNDFIVSLSPEILDGRINGRRLQIRNQIFIISENYKTEVEKRFSMLYEKI